MNPRVTGADPMSKPLIEIVETKDGFEARHGEESVSVVPDPFGTGIRIANVATVGLYEYRRLVELLVDALMKQREVEYYGREPASVRKLNWRLARHRRFIGKAVHHQWERMLATVDPTVLSVQQALFAATIGCPDLALGLELYQRPSLVRDAERYRAFAAVLARAPALIGQREEYRVLQSPEFAQLSSLAARAGLNVHVTGNGRFGGAEPEKTEILDQLEDDWRGLLSPTGESYRSLNRTIEHLPGGIPHGLLPYLTGIQLERPVTDRIELLSLLLSVRYGHHHQLVFARSSREQLIGAMQLVAEYTRISLSPRRTRDIKYMVSFLNHYPGGHAGTAKGLARKWIRWHRELAERRAEQSLARVARRETATPPIEPPDDPELTFLGHTADLVHEGERMGNCISSYAHRAVGGWCFVFHVERDEGATVVVDQRGRVHEARGPHNRHTAASRWGHRKLAAWGAAFPPDYTPDNDAGIPFHEPYDDIPF